MKCVRIEFKHKDWLPDGIVVDLYENWVNREIEGTWHEEPFLESNGGGSTLDLTDALSYGFAKGRKDAENKVYYRTGDLLTYEQRMEFLRLFETEKCAEEIEKAIDSL